MKPNRAVVETDLLKEFVLRFGVSTKHCIFIKN